MKKRIEEFGAFEWLGVVLRFPIFLSLIFLKLLIILPIEIILRIGLQIPFTLIGALFKVLGGMLFTDKDKFWDAKFYLKELVWSFKNIEFADFKGSKFFLFYGRFPNSFELKHRA